MAVDWARVNRMKLERDLLLVPHAGTDRSEPMEDGGLVTKAGFDATAKAGDRVEGIERALPPQVQRDAARGVADECLACGKAGLAEVGARAMDRFNLGAHTRNIRTSSAEAQLWFDLGLNWCFGFNQEEGVKCFRRALEFDPECVMAHWGIAYGSGPFYNLTWRDYGKAEADRFTGIAFRHLQVALGLSAGTEDAERHLVEALTRRFQEPSGVSPEQFDTWDDDYAAAMRRVHHAFPDDHDIMALLVEALITRTPRRLWDVKTGLPARNADTLEALALCERSMAMTDKVGQHPHLAILHLHIHVMEMSNHPEQALRSADLLSTMAPDAGHLNHMPGHIYALCGDYEKARIVSERSIRADDMYADYAGSFNFYVTARGHDLHLMMHTCMFLGQYLPALSAADKIREIMTEDILTMKDRPKLVATTEAYYAMKMHVLVRFGRWREIIEEPLPGDPEIYTVSIPMHHYARGIAYATLKDPVAADRERTLFRQAVARIPANYKFLSNVAHTTLAVARRPCSTARSSTTKAITNRPMPVCARPSSATITSTTPNHGPGCIRRAMRWRRC